MPLQPFQRSHAPAAAVRSTPATRSYHLLLMSITRAMKVSTAAVIAKKIIVLMSITAAMADSTAAVNAEKIMKTSPFPKRY